jgi:hypothetical protein
MHQRKATTRRRGSHNSCNSKYRESYDKVQIFRNVRLKAYKQSQLYTMGCVTKSTVKLFASKKSIPSLALFPPICRPRQVTFSSEGDIVYFANYSSQELTAQTSVTNVRWYNRTDYKDFKNEMKDTIQAIFGVKGQLKTLNVHDYTLVGLENSLSYRHVRERKQSIISYTHMIIEEQKYYQPEQLQHISVKLTESSIRRAYLRGLVYHDLWSSPSHPQEDMPLR